MFAQLYVRWHTPVNRKRKPLGDLNCCTEQAVFPTYRTHRMQIAIALVQLDIVLGDPDANLTRMEKFIRKAAKKGAQLVVFPEDAVSGPLGGQIAALPRAAEFLAFFQQLAVECQVDLVPGSWAVSDGTFAYNTAFYINKDGTVAGSYRKINLWETERATITPGHLVSVFPTAYGMVGLIICWDLAFPPLFTEMARQGAELIIAPTYWSFTKPSHKVDDVIDDEILLIDSLCTARAFENNAIVAYCNAAGELVTEGYDAVLSGRSQITHPHDKVLVKAEGNEEKMLFVTATLERVVPAAVPGAVV